MRTTVPEPADQVVPDLLKRDFTAEAANRRYVGDITYLPLADGQNLYLVWPDYGEDALEASGPVDGFELLCFLESFLYSFWHDHLR